MTEQDPIHFVEFPEDNEWEGPIPPGWYFWTETWADRIGPFESMERAEEALQDYIKAS